MNLKQQIAEMVAAWGVLGLFMVLFQPDKLPVVVLILPFVLLFAAFYSTWKVLSLLRLRYIAKGKGRVHKRLGMALSLCAVLLIVLQSLGQLTPRDVVTVVAIVCLGYLYAARSRVVLPKR